MRGIMPKTELRTDWATHAATVYACKTWHYSKSVPLPPLVKIGVWENRKFVGVVVFSRGATPRLLKPFGLNQTQGCELTRIALTKHATPVSRIVKLAILFLKKKSPELRLIVSFADPSEGHHGGVYQAGNWIYSGTSSPSTEYIGPDGKRIHNRMVAKQGFTTVQGVRRRVLTPDQCLPVKKPGKHRYLMPLDDAMRAQIAPLSKPYPKRDKQAITDDQSAERRGSTDRHAPILHTAKTTAA
jgi:hypothetical protein